MRQRVALLAAADVPHLTQDLHTDPLELVPLRIQVRGRLRLEQAVCGQNRYPREVPELLPALKPALAQLGGLAGEATFRDMDKLAEPVVGEERVCPQAEQCPPPRRMPSEVQVRSHTPSWLGIPQLLEELQALVCRERLPDSPNGEAFRQVLQARLSLL